MKMRTSFARGLFVVALTAFGFSARAVVHSYTVDFTPAPGVTSTGTGSGTVLYDDAAHLLVLEASWSGLVGNTSVSHIHLPTLVPFTGTANVVITPGTLAGFPVGVTSGTYSNAFDMTSASTYPAQFVTDNGGVAGAEAAVFNAFQEGRAYWNIHTSFAGGGEINGFVTVVPEPSALTLAGLGAGAVVLRIRRRSRHFVSKH